MQFLAQQKFKSKTLCVKESQCIKCRLCEKVCPTGAMKFIGDNTGNTKRVLDLSKCIKCGLCAEVCPKAVLCFAKEDVGNTLSLSKVPSFHKGETNFHKIKSAKSLLASKKQLTKTVYRLEFVLNGTEKFFFLPGQYADIHFDELFLRPYSIANIPDLDGGNRVLEFVVDTLIGGAGSKAVKKLKEGDELSISGPYGTLILDPEGYTSPALFIATGTGIAPFLSMIPSLLLNAGNTEVMLIFGVRHEEDLFYINELNLLKQKFPNFSFAYTLSQANENYCGLKGRVTDHIKKLRITVPNTRIYLCGGSSMIDSSLQEFKDLGISSRYIYYEKFL